MGRDRRSRSPKSDRHHRSSHHRDRSRDCKSLSSKHKKHRRSSPTVDRDHSNKNRSKEESHRSTDSVSVKRYDTTQRGIDAARNRLRASLGTAINDLRVSDQPATSRGDYNFSESMSVFDTLNRQKAIEEIEQPGFVPSRFTSGSNDAGTSAKKADGGESADVKMHERAIFGAMWTSREIEQKLAKQKGGSGPVDEKMDIDEDNGEDVDLKLIDLPEKRSPADSLAHELLSADPTVREAKWLKIFRHRRRALIEGH